MKLTLECSTQAMAEAAVDKLGQTFMANDVFAPFLSFDTDITYDGSVYKLTADLETDKPVGLEQVIVATKTLYSAVGLTMPTIVRSIAKMEPPK